MATDYIRKILDTSVYEVAVETPLHHAKSLSARLNNTVLLKREDLQPVHSFKLRGAYQKMATLSEGERGRGVITASAGNHAQGVALAAQRMGIRAIIYMPLTTPRIKIDSVKKMGAKIVLEGDTYDEASAAAQARAKEENLVFVPPYDDPDVIAGQGTVAMEILHQHRKSIHAIFVPVGGGGLLAGVAAYVKFLRPDVKVIGVEADNSACLYEAMKAGKRVQLKSVGIFADGVAVKQIGKEPFRIVQNLIDDVILVTTDEICAAIKDIFEETRSLTEPAGALALAGMKKYIEKTGAVSETLVAINSGANVNFDRLRHIADRAEVGEHREALVAIRIPEKAGSLARFCLALGKRSITEFDYRFQSHQEAVVLLGLSLKGTPSERTELVAHFNTHGFHCDDLTDNELVKLHVRYMVGGLAPEIRSERLVRLQIPERPGALLELLQAMKGQWNITLFHYRNVGLEYGRVLLGIDDSENTGAAFFKLLVQQGYAFTDETENSSYRLFLRPDQTSKGVS
jgi:threonine dehydratase